MEIITIDRGSLEEIIIKAVTNAMKQRKAEPPIERSDRIDINEASRITGLKVSTIYKKVHDQAIPHRKFSKRLVFYRSELIKWMEESTSEKSYSSEAMNVTLAKASKRKQ